MALLYKFRNFFITFLLRFLPIKKDVILFESYPELSGSPWMIYREMIKRGFGEKYKLIWVVDSSFKTPVNIRSINFFGKRSLKKELRMLFYLSKAKIIIDSNRYVRKKNPSTFRLYCQHGAPLKGCYAYCFCLGDVDAVLSLSKNMSVYDEELYPSAKGRFVFLGYPTNDALFEKIDLYSLGFWRDVTQNSVKYNKIIGWLPTYRQHRNGGSLCSTFVFPFGIPLVKSENDFVLLNNLLKKENILLAIQMHHAQAQNFPKRAFSNIVLIEQSIKESAGVSTANLMQGFDAMITDYSAAYHEYLMLNRPLALSIDDFDEYSKNPGFALDYFEWIKGVYLKNVTDLMNFIKDVASGVDCSKTEREGAMHRIHKYIDNKSTQRVVDFLVEKAML